MQFEQAARIECREKADGELQSRDQKKQENLPIEMRSAQVAGNPAVDAEIDHGGERPDVFEIGEVTEAAGETTHQEIGRERPELVVQHGWKSEGCTAGHGGQWTQKNAEQDGDFKREIGREKVRDRDADPNTEDERETDQRDQAEGLSRGSSRR